MEKQVETELKLRLAPENWPALVAAPLVRDKVQPGSERLLQLVSTYYDTKNWDLRRAGMAYRVRQTGTAAFEATVKMDKGVVRDGLSERKEITVPLTSAQPVVRAFTAAGLDLTGLVKEASLQPLFTVTVARQVKLLQLDRETVAELALDRGEVRAGQKAAPIAELELELKSGSLKTLLTYAIALAEQFKLGAGLQSKYEQGLGLLGEPIRQQQGDQPAAPALQKLLAAL
jgi:triphosphatase